MQRLFYGLVNGSLGDPGVYLELAGDAVLVDCGDLRPLSAARIHRVSDLLISHAHVDHIFGFDWLFRVFLGSSRSVRIFGPEGIADRIAAKLEGYTWNIDLDFTFTAEVHELFPVAGLALHTQLIVQKGIRATQPVEIPCPGGVFAETRSRRLRAVEVDGTPCLAFSCEQKRGVRVRDADLDRLGLPRGAWIKELKAAVLEGAPERPIDVGERSFAAGALAAEIAEAVPGAKIAYVTDTTLTPEVRPRLIDLARDATVLVCEAKFLERDRAKAVAARHLTARDAGGLARDAGAAELVLFHPSPRYESNYAEVLDEARAVFPNARFQEGPAAELRGT